VKHVEHQESIRHVLLDCIVAKDFWSQTRLAAGVKIPSLQTTTWASDLMSDICTKREQAVILCGMWALWMMRNKRRHGEQSMTLQQAALWARDTAFDLWQLVHKPEPREPVSVAPGWKPPESGWVKVNTDAASHAGRKEGATASII